MAAEHRHAHDETGGVGDGEDPLAEQPEGDDRLGRAALAHDEEHDEDDPDDGHGDDLAATAMRSPRGSAEGGHQQQGGHADEQQQRAEVVDLVLGPHGPVAQHDARDDEGDGADRKVDVEDPPP